MMKFAFSLKNKLKIAFLLFCIMCCTLLIRFLEDKSVEKINNSFISMYNDRLVPSTDLYFIAENLYAKNTTLQNLLIFASEAVNPLHTLERLNLYNQSIDSLINKYELTLLVKEEKTYLTDLKNALVVQRSLEENIIRAGTNGGIQVARQLYENTGRQASAQSLHKLSDLIKIQSTIGDKLIKDSKVLVSGTKIYSAVQVMLAVAIGILIVGIVAASNLVKIEKNKFNLN